MPNWSWYSVGDALIKAFQSSPTPSQRPANATLPPNGVESLVGVYEDLAYDRIELCLASATTTTNSNSPACEALLSNITTVLPGTVNLNSTIPTLLAKWDRPFGAYIRLTHFNQSVFGLSIFNSYVSKATLFASPGNMLLTRICANSPRGTLRLRFGRLLSLSQALLLSSRRIMEHLALE